MQISLAGTDIVKSLPEKIVIAIMTKTWVGERVRVVNVYDPMPTADEGKSQSRSMVRTNE